MRAVVSPHLDDAVLSCGQWLAESKAPVITVFCAVPSDGGLTAYDASCGFHTSNEAMLTRLAEDAAALSELGCAWARADWYDGQYDGDRPSPETLAVDIGGAMDQMGAEGLLAPAGIQHPDHRLVAEACRLLAGEGRPTWVYEELPYRVMYPEMASAALQAWRDEGCMLVEDFLGAGDLAAKERAVAMYASQRFHPHSPFVPERFWQVRCID